MGAFCPIDDVIEQMPAEGDLEDFLSGTVDRLRYVALYRKPQGRLSTEPVQARPNRFPP